ncbi:hypothetical protein QJS10_CPB17g00542 [Acorus calamus]|uniref:Secreted protein n=1 Tax=Acorus calamus TaxID=4465 RepID=A0AAV9CSL4_ACOCL|nr:hypothetical protein QJS10_CPB17g00542 [Acorus calamus]
MHTAFNAGGLLLLLILCQWPMIEHRRLIIVPNGGVRWRWSRHRGQLREECFKAAHGWGDGEWVARVVVEFDYRQRMVDQLTIWEGHAVSRGGRWGRRTPGMLHR